jgi:hypothetical protein
VEYSTKGTGQASWIPTLPATSDEGPVATARVPLSLAARQGTTIETERLRYVQMRPGILAKRVDRQYRREMVIWESPLGARRGFPERVPWVPILVVVVLWNFDFVGLVEFEVAALRQQPPLQWSRTLPILGVRTDCGVPWHVPNVPRKSWRMEYWTTILLDAAGLVAVVDNWEIWAFG